MPDSPCVVGCRDGTLETGEEHIRRAYPGADALNETAAFIAGMPLARNDLVREAGRFGRYSLYRGRMDATWERFVRNNLEKIESWRGKTWRPKRVRFFIRSAGRTS